MDGIFEYISHENFENMNKPQFNKAYTIREFFKADTAIVKDRISSYHLNHDSVYLNELKNIEFLGVEVPYIFKNFREVQMPDPLEEIFERELELV